MNNLTSTTGPGDYDLFDHLVECIENQGYAILPGALPMALVDGLYLHLKSLDTERFKPAGIGRQADEMNNPFVRTDRIRWLDPSVPVMAAYLDWTEHLRLAINRRLFLGLFDYECHFAHYPPGAYYKRHLDAFQGERNRVLTTVCYFNPNWQPGDGGQLLIHDPQTGELMETVQPAYGTMVVFLSERFPHEVLPAQRDRYSIAGWYRVINNQQGRIDPPR
ncbi:MAG: 2OG-Fe(II) oxygenase [Candidatus Thiodiazotropha sp.]